MTSSTEFHLRTAGPQDAEAIAQFNINIAWETEKIALLPDVILSGVRNLMSSPERGFYLVVETTSSGTSTIVASLMVTTEWSDWRNGTFWWIQSVYVDAEWRRKGLYSMMYEKVKSLAADQTNVCGFRLYVEQENIVAQKTYENVGMHRTHYQLFEELKPDLIYHKT